MENESLNVNQEVQSSPISNMSSEPSIPNATEHNTLMAILAYLGILIIIPFLVAKDDSFVKFHIKQGLVLVIIEIIVYALGMSMIWALFPVISIIQLVLLVLSIIGIVNVVQGQEKKLPLIGHLADNFTF